MPHSKHVEGLVTGLIGMAAVIALVLLYGMALATQDGEATLPADHSSLAERHEAVRRAPTDPRARMELGLAYFQAEDYDFALAELVEAITLNPDNRDNMAAQANYHLGIVLMAIDRVAPAINAFREALRLGWKDAAAYVAMGQALTSQGKLDEAIVHYREALRLSPDKTEAHAGLGLAYEAAGHMEEAVTAYERYLQSVPTTNDHAADAIRQRLTALKERLRL